MSLEQPPHTSAESAEGVRERLAKVLSGEVVPETRNELQLQLMWHFYEKVTGESLDPDDFESVQGAVLGMWSREGMLDAFHKEVSADINVTQVDSDNLLEQLRESREQQRAA
ncbi:MAG: hypothetical protein WDZ82_01570 [Candidatus Paceibacterota bacterium]